MLKTRSRPKFLNLTQIRMPVNALVSIAHRLSGVWLVITIPVVLYLLELSLSQQQGFEQAQDLLAALPMQLFLFIGLWALFHHLFAGIRFLLLDLDMGVERQQARRTAQWVVVVEVVALIIGAVVLL